MSLDFQNLKTIPIVEVLARRGISLRYNGDWGAAVCPLPSHKTGDKDRTFQVNVRQNYFKCWSKSCNEKAGVKGGDCINLVALLENCSQLDAAKKLAEMFHIENKTAEHIAQRPNQKQNIKRTDENFTSPAVAGKGFMHETGIWLDDLLEPIVGDPEIRKTLKKTILNRLHQSYLNGKSG